MNNKGFAVSGFIYTILIVFIGLLIAILALLNSRKAVLDNLKNKILGEVNTTTLIGEVVLEETKEILEYSAPANGYYNFKLYSPKIGEVNGSTISFDLFLSKGETLYVLVGANNYNNGITEIRKTKYQNTSFATSSSNTNKNNVSEVINNTVISNVSINENNYTGDVGKVVINYINKARQNESLNQVKYIKDCVVGNSSDNTAIWSEVKAILNGENKALGRGITLTVNGEVRDIAGIANIVDNNNETSITVSEEGEVCILVDLQIPRNLDSIEIHHKRGVTFYGSKTYVSIDGVNYDLIRTYEQKEDKNGLVISAYETEQVEKVGNVYVPIKEFDGAVWLRLFHHNNLGGTVLWDALPQVTIDGGHNSLHKQSVLYNVTNYKNNGNKYEFLLEYSDRTGYNRWIQTSNPLEKTESTTGLEIINNSLVEEGYPFTGIAKSSNDTSTRFDCSGGSDRNNWYYAIGAVKSFEEGIPANNAIPAKETVDLWVRIDNLGQ